MFSSRKNYSNPKQYLELINPKRDRYCQAALVKIYSGRLEKRSNNNISWFCGWSTPLISSLSAAKRCSQSGSAGMPNGAAAASFRQYSPAPTRTPPPYTWQPRQWHLLSCANWNFGSVWPWIALTCTWFPCVTHCCKFADCNTTHFATRKKKFFVCFFVVVFLSIVYL